jgi:hypothetical protein
VSTDQAVILGPVIAAAERALTNAWGGSVGLLPLNAPEAVRPHSTVARCLVRADYADAPVTVIVKSARDYDPADLSPHAPAGRLLNEWAALRFLSELGTDLAPRLYAADRHAGLLVIEDLGSGASLQEVLDGDKPREASAALTVYAMGLGKLHAATRGRLSDLQALRDELGVTTTAADPFVTMWPTRNLPVLPGLCAELGATWTDAAQQDLDRVVEAIAEAGPFLALSQGDTCPENHRLHNGGVRFLDFEFSGFRHALLDAAFLWLPFPTCQHVARLPKEHLMQADAAYRAALGLPDGRFSAQMLHARAWWTMLSLGAYLRQALEADRTIGSASMRQRLVLWLDTFVDGCQEADQLEALSTIARKLGTTLRMLWGPAVELQTFRAFSQSA